MIKIQGVSLLMGGDIILGVDNIYVSPETPSAIQEHLDSMSLSKNIP